MFPQNDINSLKLLNQLKKDFVIRFLKEDVMMEFDPNLPLEEQENRLPRKQFFHPRELGTYTMLPEQAEAIRLLMSDFEAFEKEYGRYFKKEDFLPEDRARIFGNGNRKEEDGSRMDEDDMGTDYMENTGDKEKKKMQPNYLSKKHVYRQVINNPKYV
jgi:hypothetical protein